MLAETHLHANYPSQEVASSNGELVQQPAVRSWRYRIEALSGHAARGSAGPSPQMERQAAARCKG